MKQLKIEKKKKKVEDAEKEGEPKDKNKKRKEVKKQDKKCLHPPAANLHVNEGIIFTSE